MELRGQLRSQVQLGNEENHNRNASGYRDGSEMNHVTAHYLALAAVFLSAPFFLAAYFKWHQEGYSQTTYLNRYHLCAWIFLLIAGILRGLY